MRNFRTIFPIVADDKSTWDDAVFLTFDIDWANDDVLNDTIAIMERAETAATWFVTHDTAVLNRLRANPRFELGIHPNFNFLLEGDPRNGRNAREVIERLMEIVPEAKSVRSHSMTQSSGLLELFKSAGLTHDVNHFVPHYTGIELTPWQLWNGLCRVPYCWEDDVNILYAELGLSDKSPTAIALASEVGFRVFDFHPIHVFLNTESLDRYERTRPLHQHPKELIKHRYEGCGTRNRLIELLELAKP